MGTLDSAWRRVADGETVTVHPRGHSMAGLVADGATVVVQPCHAEALEIGDVVLVRVAGAVYLHKVIAVDRARKRVLIGNNRGGTNGWTQQSKVAGIAVTVDGAPRPRIHGKVRS